MLLKSNIFTLKLIKLLSLVFNTFLSSNGSCSTPDLLRGICFKLKVNFGAMAKVTGIATQGRSDANHWVSEYTLSYSLDGGHFEPVKKVFNLNHDSIDCVF